uniref:Chromosome 1 open reading frame 194 n=1 Tax=Eptatretus burgeri TaxID=7764 RepID=A0A8C4PWE1_EPTBU
MIDPRGPGPLPKLGTDRDVTDKGRIKKYPHTKGGALVFRDDSPWKRLHTTHTLNSARAVFDYFDPQAPRDSLDFVLKAQYDHSTEFLRDKSRTLIQKETLGDDHGRILKNRTKEFVLDHDPMNSPLVKWTSPTKSSIYSRKGTIESYHTANANNGFSRKEDGGFYCT